MSITKHTHKATNVSEFRLKIICTTDLHMELSGYDDLTECHLSDRGLNKLKPLIAAERHDMPCVVVDNGDFFQGNPLADHLSREPNHPRSGNE